MRRGLGITLVAAAVVAGCTSTTDLNVKQSCHDFAKRRIGTDPSPRFSSEKITQTGTDARTGLPRYLLSGYVSYDGLNGPHSTNYACEVLLDKAAKKVRLNDLEIPGT